MPGDYLPDDLKLLWKELSASPLQISLDQLRKEAEMLRKGLRRRSFLGGGAAWVVIAAFVAFIFVFPNPFQRIGSVLTVAGAAYMLVQLRMRPARGMPEMGETECIRFYQNELERQRDFHRGKWFWSRLLVLLPGPLLFLVGFAQAYPNLAPVIWLEFATFLILAAIAVLLNLRLARKYQGRIDALNVALRSNGELDKKN
jgi:Mg2+/citrate symporter